MIDQGYLKECFDLREGVLYWRASRPASHFSTENTRKIYLTKLAGKPAGNCDKCGYVKVRLNKKLMYAHRIIWVMVHGDLPDNKMIDHIDGDGFNNLPENLRLADRTTNGRNSSMKINNTSGFTGVYWHSQNKRWCACGAIEGKTRHIGCFLTKQDAYNARLRWQKKVGRFTERHGKYVEKYGQ